MMGLALLPLERLPLYVWGAVLFLLGGYLALHEDPFSWPQGRAVLLAVVGVAAVLFDLRRRLRKRTEPAE